MSTLTALTSPPRRYSDNVFDSAERIDRNRLLIDDFVVIEVLAHTADGVAAHLALAAIEVEHPHFSIATSDGQISTTPSPPIPKCRSTGAR